MPAPVLKALFPHDKHIQSCSFLFLCSNLILADLNKISLIKSEVCIYFCRIHSDAFLSYDFILKFLFYERFSPGVKTLKFISFGKAKFLRVY
jgi:hypothetical protein